MESNKTIESITQLVFVENAPESVDLVLVLGSPSISNILPAVYLHSQGLADLIVISGHGPNHDSLPEWKIYSDFALNAGVEKSSILIEPNARNTHENFVLSSNLIEQAIGWRQIKKIAICCKPIHTRRALMTARRNIPKSVEILMLPPNHPSDIHAYDWWQTSKGRDRVFGEIRRIGEYASKGDITID